MLKVDITEIASQYLDISQFTRLFCIVCGCIRFAYAKYDSHNLRSGHMPWVIVRGISFRYSHVSNEGLPWLVWRHTRSRKGRNVFEWLCRGAPGYCRRAIVASGATLPYPISHTPPLRRRQSTRSHEYGQIMSHITSISFDFNLN